MQNKKYNALYSVRYNTGVNINSKKVYGQFK